MIPHAAFFLSGIAGLGCQMIWSRLFANGLGHEMPAVLAVVGAFFGGLALGGWSLNETIRRSAHPERWYAALEIIIGLWAILSVALIPFANEITLRLAGPGTPGTLQVLAEFALPFFTLLPATAAMGATWPAMERLASSLQATGNSAIPPRELERILSVNQSASSPHPSPPLLMEERVPEVRKVVGGLYAANTLGAVVGVLAGAFVLLPALGCSRSLFIFAALNFTAAALIWRRSAPLARQDSDGSGENVAHGKALALRGILFATGLLGIGYEVVGVRVLAQVLENTIYTFAVALAAYLLGTATGGAAFQRFLRGHGGITARNWLLLAAALACAAGGLVLAGAKPLYDAARAVLGDSVSASIAAEMAVAAAVFFPASAAMGMLFSQLAESARAAESGVGRAIALNTLGGALAPLVFGFALIPLAGSKWALAGIAAGYLALMLPALNRWQALAALLPVLSLSALPARLQSAATPPGGAVIEETEGAMDSVAVVRHADGHRSLLVNNRFTMGGTGAATAERRHAHIPLLLHPHPKRALFLGLGTGITFAACGAHPGLEADGVELLPEIIAAMRHFEPENSLPREGNRFRIHAADARRFVRADGDAYDVIVADLFHPARDGAGTLYTREHFQAIRSRLAAGGLFCQWLPLYQLDEPVLKVITRTFLDVFPEGSAWLLRFNADTPVIGLIAATGSEPSAEGWFATRTKDKELAARLAAAQLRNDFELLGCRLAGAEPLRAYAVGAEVNTDDRPVVVFEAPKLNYRRHAPPYGRLLALLGRFPPPEGSGGFVGELADYRRARDIFLRGLIDEADGRPGAVEKFIESAAASRQFTTAYAYCLSLASQQAKSNPAAARAILERLEKARPERPVARQLLDRLSPP